MIKKLIPLAAGMLLPAMLLAATPTPIPSPSPTPARSEISDHRVPYQSVVIYGTTAGGEYKRVLVNADGKLVIAPTPAP